MYLFPLNKSQLINFLVESNYCSDVLIDNLRISTSITVMYIYLLKFKFFLNYDGGHSFCVRAYTYISLNPLQVYKEQTDLFQVSNSDSGTTL